MNKFIKFTIGAIVALLIVSLAHGLEVREPLVARQYGDADPKAPKSIESTSTPAPTTTLLGKIPVPDATPTDAVDTFSAATTYSPDSPAASGSPAPKASGYAPSGTGSLIPQWASLTASGGVPTNPSSAPAATTTPKSAESASSAHKIETGLINGAIIAGIVGYFF